MEISFEPIEHPSTFEIGIEWTIFLLQVFLCTLSAYLLVFHASMATIVAALIRTRLESRHQSAQLKTLAAELRQLKVELSLISPTGQYAAYIRKEREMNGKRDEFEKEKEMCEGSLPTKMKIDMIGKLVVHGASFILMWITAHLSFACLPTNVFYPISYLFAWPRIPYFSSDTGGCAEDTSRISLFIVIAMFFTTVKNFKSRTALEA
ncbi:unnamed protein product, partial [Mesorhabditis belari]|uniref:Guided entry of tail-anchored proteins factor 1 n=1 Tax=Mesorhabditis belari TaxID=2138241 RepID=A0AAF3EJ80_9BILA